MNDAEAELARLIARGGWDLGDPRELGETFEISPSQFEQVRPGASVKLLFELVTIADRAADECEPYDEQGKPNLVIGAERMWVLVERQDGNELVGVLNSLPTATHTRLVPGARLRFGLHHIIDVRPAERSLADALSIFELMQQPLLDELASLRPEDPQRDPTVDPAHEEVCRAMKVRPDPVSPLSTLMVGRSVREGVSPVFGGRLYPADEHDGLDSGWLIWAVEPDLETAGESEEHGFDIVDVQELRGRHREAWKQLALPPGWGFTIEDGEIEQYFDPAMLEEGES